MMSGDIAKRPSALWLGLSLAALALAAPSMVDAQPHSAMSTYRPPSKDPRNIAGAYQPQTDTKLFPVEGGLPVRACFLRVDDELTLPAWEVAR